MSFFKQPLVHFLCLGFLLFVVFELTASRESADEKTIVVDRDGLLTFLQFRAKSFNPGRFAQRLDTMPPEQLARLIDEYVREEALHREALSLGLDTDDYIIRQRLVQKMEYLAAGSEESPEVNIEAYFEQHLENYRIDSAVTFTHVFVNRENFVDRENSEAIEQAQQSASELLTVLQSRGVGFADAITYGDRFVFHKNYVDRTEDFIASHFGKVFARTVFELPAGTWQGPIYSAYGYHLVLVSDKKASRLPSLSEVIDNVTYDARQAAASVQTEAAIQEIVDGYRIENRL